MAYHFIATLAGQDAIAEAIASGEAISLTHMAVGDGGGAHMTPLETMTGLYGVKATVPLDSVVRDGVQVDVTGTLPHNIGGWTIRELGILNSDGVLLFVGNYPDTTKSAPGETGGDELVIIASLIISDTAQVTINVSGSSYASHDYVNEQVSTHRTHAGTPIRPYFIAVDSIVQNAPPVTPAIGATYVVPPDASGDWAAHANKIAQYRGDAGWTYVSAPAGQTVCDGSTGLYWRRTSSGWRQVMASMPEHLAGTSTALTTHPAGVKALVQQEVSSIIENNVSSFFRGMM